jgi:hypothetical protein
MGRPINNRYIGNVSGSGQQIEATAYFTCKPGAALAYICSQKATNTYNMVSVCGNYSNRVELTNGGVALQPGQANVTVKPYGFSGSGATATANLGATSFTVVSGGSGTYANGYVPGQILCVSGGTHTANKQSNATVTSVSLGAVGNIYSDTGYTVGDTFTWNYAGWSTPTIITVATTTGNGNISGVTLTSVGSTTNTSVSNTTVYSSATTTNAWANSATFGLRWDASGLTVNHEGDYTSPPSNPVSFTAASGHGTGATATVGYGLSSVQVTAGGSGYQAVTATVSGNGGASVGATVTCGAVTALSICGPGSYGPTRPTITIAPIASLEYAQVIRNLTVTTFLYNTYEWVPTGCTPRPGQAVLQTA